MVIQHAKEQKALRRAPVITLLTDFGYQDAYIGIMKGVIAGINPSATVIDICHDIPPQDVFGGAYLLSTAYQYFPRGTIHVAVVDPGVGGKRDIVCVEFRDCFFIVPDNGLLSFVMQQESPCRITRATNSRYFLPSPSNTFHGRDIFAPVAAYMSLGVKLHRLGNKIDRLERLHISAPVPGKSDQWVGEVLYIDRFGNLITNISMAHLLQYGFDSMPSAPTLSPHGLTKKNQEAQNPKLEPRNLRLETVIGKEKIVGLCTSYMDADKGGPLAIFGSTGYLEISINQGNAQKHFKARRGSKVTVRILALTI